MKSSEAKQNVDYRVFVDNYVVLAVAACFFYLLFYVLAMLLSESMIVSCFAALACLPFALSRFIKYRRKTVMKKVEQEFTEIMQSVLTSVSAGLPVERAFAEIREIVSMNSSEEKRYKFFLKEVDAINMKTEMNYSFFSLLEDFAYRSGSRDIINLAKALTVSGSAGGNAAYIMRNALANMRVKADSEKEIAHTLALPKYNHRIITLMPFFLTLMLKLLSKSYVEVLYMSSIGKTVMFCVAIMIFVAWFLGDCICDIKI
jgi:Flp pilus assembly protein TadB